MRRLALGLLLAAAAPAAAAAQQSDYLATSLTVSLRDSSGKALRSALPGQRVVVVGRLTPGRRGARVAVSVTRDGVDIADRSTRVTRVSGEGVGRFETSVRVRTAGAVTVSAVHQATPRLGDAVSEPVPLTIDRAGDPKPGCRSTATVAEATRARLGRRRLERGVLLAAGARLEVPRDQELRLRRDGATYRAQGGTFRVECDGLLVQSGLAFVTSGRRKAAHTRMSGMDVRVDPGSSALTASAPKQVRFSNGTGAVAQSDGKDGVEAVAGDIVLFDGDRPRLSTWPFAASPEQRVVTGDAGVPKYWQDGRPCSFGCRPGGVKRGWPLKPFNQQHPLRSGLNERRPANAHIGVDIQAYGNQRVYAMQSGTAHISDIGTSDQHIRVGSYEYWHVNHAVSEGQYVRAYKTVIGRLVDGARHLHVSELGGGGYVNPLRPGGIPFKPYTDTEAPVIGAARGGSVEVFDPQSFRRTIYYRTPVLAPAAVAWRAVDRSGNPTGPFHFTYRGTVHYGSSGFYAPGTEQPYSPAHRVFGWGCFGNWTVCIPHWRYPVASGPVAVYAWDWTGNVSTRITT